MFAMATDPAIGTTIKKRRQVLGMTQDELAARLGVSRSTIANWESGKHFPLRYLGAVEHVLGIELNDGAEPPIDPRVRQMIDDLTDEERAWAIHRLTGRPLPAAGEPGRERGAS